MGILGRAHVEHLLVGYLGGALPPAERDHVAHHLRACAHCRRALAAEERLAAELRARLPVATAPRPRQMARLWPGIAARVGRGDVPRQGQARALAPTFGMVLTFGLLCALALPLLLGGGANSAQATHPQSYLAASATVVTETTTASVSAVALARLTAATPTPAPVSATAFARLTDAPPPAPTPERGA